MSSEPIPQFSTSSQLVFQDETLRFNCHQPPAPPPQRHVSDPGFIEDRYFAAPQGGELRRGSSVYVGDRSEMRDQPRSDQDDDDDVDEDDDDVGEFVDGVNKSDNNCSNVNENSSGSVRLHGGNDGSLNQLQQRDCSGFGSSREVMMKDGNSSQSVSNVSGGVANEGRHEGRLNGGYNSVTTADHDAGLYYSQFLRGAEGSGSVQKNVGAQNLGGASGRKDSASCLNESGESLRSILSDPITGALMDDAMILPCGHSFGSGGIQHIIRMKACHTCLKTVSEDQITPNLSLRVAVQAYRREEESQIHRSSKRRRDRFEQDKVGYSDLSSGDLSRIRGAQFPFAVTDRVIIKGNKRTPERFVGREAVVTTQCLNGWYVVKTLDNAESVKVQYRSLAKVPDDRSILKDNVKQSGSHLASDF